MLLKCIKDVIMTDGTKAFTEGHLYRGYYYSGRDWDSRKVFCAKNDQKKRHIIRGRDGLDEFYTRHFAEGE